MLIRPGISLLAFTFLTERPEKSQVKTKKIPQRWGPFCVLCSHVTAGCPGEGRLGSPNWVIFLHSVVRLLGKPGARCKRRTVWSLPGYPAQSTWPQGPFFGCGAAPPLRKSMSLCWRSVCCPPPPSGSSHRARNQEDLVPAFHL